MKEKNDRQVIMTINFEGDVIMIEIPYKELTKKIKIAQVKKRDTIELICAKTQKKVTVNVDNAKEIARQARLIYKKEEQKEQIFETLKEYLTDKTLLYKRKNVGSITGRDEEIRRIWTCLNCKQKNNAILIGEDGVGKKSITNEIVRQIVSKECPKEFEDFSVFKLEIGKILRLPFENQIRRILLKIDLFFKLNKNSILIVEDLTKIMYDYNILNFFYSMVINRDVKVLACIKPNEYDKIFQGETITRYFNEIEIEEPDIPTLYKMIPRRIKKIQKEYDIKISNELIKFAIDTAYYLSSSNSANPESTIDTIRYAMNKAKMDGKNEVDKSSILSYYKINFKLVNSMKGEEKKSTAYHEAGHYLVREMSENMKDRENAFVSILPIEGALGLNADYFKVGEQVAYDREYYINNIAYCLGGRAAEYVYTKSYSAGACSDLTMATSLAEELVLSFGLSENSSKNRSYTVGGYLKTFLLTDELRKEINDEINKIIDEAYKRAEKIIDENQCLLDEIVSKLLEDGILTGRELNKICKKVHK